jgi:hypothetical protein
MPQILAVEGGIRPPRQRKRNKFLTPVVILVARGRDIWLFGCSIRTRSRAMNAPVSSATFDIPAFRRAAMTDFACKLGFLLLTGP